VKGAPIDYDATYKMATKQFIFIGKDGYKCMKKSECYVDEENGDTLCNLSKTLRC
jgi:2',3'-cyclic-nucleotide 2'-phosphodiesterase (5'-nucleotidase family)